MAFPSYNRYTVSLALKSFLRYENQNQQSNDEKLEQYQDRIITLSSFLREVLYMAQVFENFYLLNGANNVDENLSNDIFDHNFWYRVCRVIYQNITIGDLQRMYEKLSGLETALN
jgi:hypothetical protein